MKLLFIYVFQFIFWYGQNALIYVSFIKVYIISSITKFSIFEETGEPLEFSKICDKQYRWTWNKWIRRYVVQNHQKSRHFFIDLSDRATKNLIWNLLTKKYLQIKDLLPLFFDAKMVNSGLGIFLKFKNGYILLFIENFWFLTEIWAN